MVFLISLQLLLVVVLVLLVVMQSSGSEGMGGLSSGFGAGGNPFVSSKAVSGFLVKVTAVVGALFVVNSVVLGVVQANRASVISSGVKDIKRVSSESGAKKATEGVKESEGSGKLENSGSDEGAREKKTEQTSKPLAKGEESKSAAKNLESTARVAVPVEVK